MKRLFLLFALIASFTCSHAQVAKLEDILKPGSRLIYTVTSNGSTYDFVVTLKDVKGNSFDWEMGSPADMKGTIIHTNKALKDAYKMYNYFASETKKLDDQTLSVWLSQKIYGTLTKGTGPSKICMYDPLEPPMDMMAFADGEFLIRVDGKGMKIYDKMVRAAKKGKDQWMIDRTVDDFFTYYNSASFPLILRMKNRFTLSLKEIKTS